MHQNTSKFQQKTRRKIYPFYPLLVHGKQFLHRLGFLRKSSTGKKPGGRSKTPAKRKGEEKKGKRHKKKKRRRKNEKPKVVGWFDWCACTNKKVVQRDSGEKQGCILPFKGHFESFAAILAYNSPKKVKNV